ncbi:MAG TPA: M48 family metallopeptidase [Candidatus Krumholzibacteria bacterium]|nr:M48 family metallopeptidase [Candidatus Krumholzibacteria bacterium]HPD71852.1 M48 family metallopeptidase [Candidatus Krumholzibacteria bacterium]HRY41215.1 M48 family metallopeptidase [Candidatus Krumholzibacteria bacterium]
MFEAIAANRRKSAALVVLMAVLLGGLGYALGEYFAQGGGLVGLAGAAVLWLILTLVSWSQGDQIFLSMSGARKVGPDDLPVLWNVVEEMTIASGLAKMPAIYVIDDPAPNAFATGRSPETASVAVTSGLLKLLDRDELQGVIAHELGHIRNRDILLMLFAGVLMGAIVLLADVGLRSWLWGGGRSRRSSSNEGGGQGQALLMILAIVLMILAPIMAQLIYFAISRKREYLADASSAAFTRFPDGLARALEKIGGAAAGALRGASRATAPMYIVNPLAAAAKKRDATSLTATHPPIAERVRILRAMHGASYQDYDQSFARVTGKNGVLPNSALADPHAGAGLRIQGAQWQEGSAGIAATATATAAPAPAAAGPAAAPSAQESRRRARAVDDWFYAQDGWRRVDCGCGATLKIPPRLAASRIKCPRCGTRHALG